MKAFLISDFNVENFGAYLKKAGAATGIDVQYAPFGQVQSVFLDPVSAGWDAGLDFVVIWTQARAVLPSFAAAVAFEPFEMADLEREVDAFADGIISVRERARFIFVCDWALAPFHQGHGSLDLSPSIGPTRLLMRMNQRMLERLDGFANIIPLHTQKWLQLVGPTAFNARLWYLAKIPYANEVFKEAAQDIHSALRGVMGKSRKVVVLDLDDTMWGGIVGDVGWQNLTLGGHDASGEAFVDFQRELKALMRRGIILAILSKNVEAVALAAIDDHPEMVLRRKDFAAWRINWEDKAANLAELAQELNVGLDAMIFIDDNPVERLRIRDMLPEVLVPDWPADPRLYPQSLLKLDCFDKLGVTEEDRNRPKMYVSERERAALKAETGSMEQWLNTLGICVAVEGLTATNSARATQLLNKTNQFNLQGRRLSDSEFRAWAAAPDRKVWTFRVSDKFGDSGIVGLLSVALEGTGAVIEDFVLSCRVFGRNIEDTMLHVASSWARTAGLGEMVANYRATAKNGPTLTFLRRSGPRAEEEFRFVWDLSSPIVVPQHITLTQAPVELVDANVLASAESAR